METQVAFRARPFHATVSATRLPRLRRVGKSAGVDDFYTVDSRARLKGSRYR